MFILNRKTVSDAILFHFKFGSQIFEAYTDTDPEQRDDEGWGEEISDAEKVCTYGFYYKSY